MAGGTGANASWQDWGANFHPYVGSRVGEASNPGPARGGGAESEEELGMRDGNRRYIKAGTKRSHRWTEVLPGERSKLGRMDPPGPEASQL